MLETLTIDLVAGGISSIGSVSLGKVQDILRRKRFSENIDDLTTEFATALKQALTDELERDIEANWATIAEELDELEVVFEDEQEAVLQITQAIGKGLEIELEANPQLREAIETAVADAYQTALREFADRVAGTDLADVFDTETNIELTATVNELEDRLISIQRQFRRQRTAALRNAGVIWLDPLYFERQEPGDPETAWRTGFDFVEVEAGYPLPRERPPQRDNGERRALTDEIIERLNDGEDLVILGDGGSGKSTVCKQVACQWRADDRGPVFYRTGTARTSFDEPGSLIEAIRAADEEVLVVVEDAATESMAPFYEVLNEFESTSDVSVLLDSRKTDWRNTDNLAGAPQLKRHRQQLSVVEMPALDPTECQRAVEHYEALTGDEIERNGEQLHDYVRNADIGGLLVLAYELTGPSGDTGDNQTVSALHDDVHRSYLSVDRWTDSDFPKTVAVMINVLNAANLPVTEAFVHALADDRDGHKTIERTLEFLEGTVFNSTDGYIQTPHQMWSALYLEHLLDAAGERIARYHFEECVNGLFHLCEEENHRTQITDWLRERQDHFTNINEDPAEASNWFVTQIAEICLHRPTLGMLYGTPETWQVSLPGSCSLDAELTWHNYRGWAHFDRGVSDAAAAEWEQVIDLVSTKGTKSTDQSKLWQSRAFSGLAAVALSQGDLDAAQDYLEQSLAIKREVGDRHGQGANLNNLGLIAKDRGQFDAAQDYLEQSLEIQREVSDRQDQAGTLNNLGIIARISGDLDAAQDYSEQSLEIQREAGDRRGQATSLHELGMVAKDRGDLNAAQDYLEQSLAIKREVGDRRGQAHSLNGLGQIAKDRGDLDAAEDHHKRALTLFKRIGHRRGQADSLFDLGMVAEDRGDFDAAKEFFEQSLAMFIEIGNRVWQSQSLQNIGRVVRMRGGLNADENPFETTFEILLDTGAESTIVSALWIFIQICEELDANDNAIEWCDRAVKIAEQAGEDEMRKHFLNRRAELTEE